MRYFLALLLPPLAVLLCGGRVFSAILNIVLTVLGWAPGVIHALIVVSSHKADKRSDKQLKSLERQTAMLQQQNEAQLRLTQQAAQAQLEQQQQIASAQLKASVEASAAIAASNLASVQPANIQPPPMPATQPPQLESKFQVARDGEIIGEFSWSEIRHYLQTGNLQPTDRFLNGNEWQLLSA